MANPVQLGPTKFKLRTDLPPDPATGQRRQVSRIFHGTKTEAKHAQSALELKYHAPDHSGTSVTCHELFARWLTHCESTVEEQTLDQYRSTVKLYLDPHLGALAVRDVTAGHLDAMYRHLGTVGGRRVKGLSPGTVKRIHQVARAAFTQAERWEWLHRNPAKLAQPPAGKRRKPDTPDTAAVELLLARMRDYDHNVYVFVELLASLGARPGEICALQWRHVDWAAGTIEIESSLTRTRNVKTTKTDRDRTIAVDDFTLALLKDHRPADSDPTWFIFGGRRPWHPARATQTIKGKREEWGIGRITPRSLRHYVATRLISNGVDVRTVAGRLGHSSPATTLNVYSAFIPENDRAAAELLRSLRTER